MIKDVVEKLVARTAFEIRDDVRRLLDDAYAGEQDAAARQALEWIRQNSDIASVQKLALCQDTGLPVVFLRVGQGVSVDTGFIDDIRNSVSGAYEKFYLRASAVDPLTRANNGYDGVIVHTEFDPSQQGIRITLLAKGFGSENKTQLKMFNPTVDYAQIEEFVVNAVKDAGPEACPPFVVGVGIGGTSDHALLMAKEAYLNDLCLMDERERALLKKINDLKIGPMGRGGNTTALALKIRTAKTHIAGLPVGVNINCWACRSASALLQSNGTIEQ